MENSYSKRNNKIRIQIINERFLNTVLKVLCSDLNITKKTINNIEYLFDIIDYKYYSKDLVVFSLMEAIKIALQHRHNSNKFSRQILITEIETNLPDLIKEQVENIIIPLISTSALSNESELSFINNTIDTYLKYSYIILSKDKLSNILTDLSSGNVNNLKEAVNSYRSIVNTINEEFRKTDNLSTNNIIHSIDEEYVDILLETYNSLKNPRHSMKTGLKLFNELLSEAGGFLVGNYYIFYASINSFKSALLQYICKWIRKYNSSNYLESFQETGRIPLVLFYSFENTLKENTQREFLMETGFNLKDIKDNEEVKKLWLNYYNETNSIIDIATIYAESGTVKVSDMRKQIHVLNDMGYQVISIVIDYLELIKPEDEDLYLDNRIKLGNISNALHVMAITEDIMVATAQQMNRSAEATMSDLREKGASNIIKSMGRQYVGESYAIDKPADFSAFLATERSIFDNKLYFTLKRGKCRYKRTELDYFVHELKHGFYIEDDYLTDKVLSKKAITNEDENALAFTVKTKNNDVLNGERGSVSIREPKKQHKKTLIEDNPDENENLLEKALENIVHDYADSFYYKELDFTPEELMTPFNIDMNDSIDNDFYVVL
jgi:replicative DNA helicase